MPADTPSPTKARLARALAALGPLLALALVWTGFALLEHRLDGTPFLGSAMFSREAVAQVVQQSVVIGIAAIGMTFVIIAAGIDLSVGSAIALASVVAAKLAVAGHGAAAVVLGTLAAGGLAGLLVGLLIVRAGLIPFITTLGTLLILRGLALGLADSQPINIQELGWLRFWLNGLPPGWEWLVIPPGGWLMLLLAGLAAATLRLTVFGRHVHAVGSNEQTARLCGVAVDRVKLAVYAIGGLFAAVAGLMLASNQGQGDPTGANGYELDVIAAVVIGGASLGGGVGSVLGSLVGALVMTVIRVGCGLNGIDDSTTRVVTGLIIVAAVLADRLRRRSAGG
ncbi:MAG: ABC transporter permease [Opitutia bacterium]|jgi:ribose/xylose/arabinose/galactoside ABC-type transport system permease subunit